VCAAAVVAVAIPALAADAGFYAADVRGWHNSANPSSTTASIPVGGSVSWENRDTEYAHPVECVQSKSNATCPWSGAKELPKKPTLGTSVVSQTFSMSGTYAFRCAVHPTMQGTVVVGSGKPPAGSTPAPTATSTQSAKSSVGASTPATTASPSTSAQTTTKAKAAKKKARAKGAVVAAPSVLGKRVNTSTGGSGGRLGGIIVAIVLILLVGTGHMTARNQGA
jgi:plastocyanin